MKKALLLGLVVRIYRPKSPSDRTMRSLILDGLVHFQTVGR